MPAGRPRKPDEVKILEGTWRPDRDGYPAASVQADGVPTCPDWLQGLARELWDSITPGLVAGEVAKARDTAALVGLCEWWALYRRLMEALTAEDVSPKLAPLAAQAGIAWDKFSQTAARFGLTPSDRAKLRVEQKPKGGVQSRRRAT